jgi:hypothetical protein
MEESQSGAAPAQAPPAPEQTAAPQQQQLQVQIPEQHFEVLYSDQAFISFNAMGFVLDFAQHSAPLNLSRVVSRIGMSPVHLKLLTQVLMQNLQGYEQRFGEIVLHPQMQDHLRERPIGFRLPESKA